MRIVQSIDLLGYPRIREDVKAQSSTLGGKYNQRNEVLAKSLLTKAFYDGGELVKATKLCDECIEQSTDFRMLISQR